MATKSRGKAKTTQTMGVRLDAEERALIERAAAEEALPGDRGGPSTWARRALLREAGRVLGSKESK